MKKDVLNHRFTEWMGIVIIVLALVRCAYPGISGSTTTATSNPVASSPASVASSADSAPVSSAGSVPVSPADSASASSAATAPVSVVSPTCAGKHRIYSVPSYKLTFPDGNDVQMVAAQKWGVKPVTNRADAEKRKEELVYVAASPYYCVDRLTQSIPYLVPRAAILLEDIGKAFFDSLYVKGLPLNRLIVTSVLRTQEDVVKLRRFNGNAMENSCHLYGTTFDICYNRYEKVEHPDQPSDQPARNDLMKYVLSEVLRDMRQNNRCYVKYEVKQGCFHMTVR